MFRRPKSPSPDFLLFSIVLPGFKRLLGLWEGSGGFGKVLEGFGRLHFSFHFFIFFSSSWRFWGGWEGLGGFGKVLEGFGKFLFFVFL